MQFHCFLIRSCQTRITRWPHFAQLIEASVTTQRVCCFGGFGLLKMPRHCCFYECEWGRQTQGFSTSTYITRTFALGVHSKIRRSSNPAKVSHAHKVPGRVCLLPNPWEGRTHNARVSKVWLRFCDDLWPRPKHLLHSVMKSNQKFIFHCIHPINKIVTCLQSACWKWCYWSPFYQVQIAMFVAAPACHQEFYCIVDLPSQIAFPNGTFLII